MPDTAAKDPLARREGIKTITLRDVANLVGILAAIGIWYFVYDEAVLEPKRRDKELELASAAADKACRDLHVEMVKLYENKWGKKWGVVEEERASTGEKLPGPKR